MKIKQLSQQWKIKKITMIKGVKLQGGLILQGSQVKLNVRRFQDLKSFDGLQNKIIMKQKLVVTLWRAQIEDQSSLKSIFCRLSYANQQQESHPILASQTLIWKETFIFGLSTKVLPLKIDLLNRKQTKQNKNNKDSAIDGQPVGKCQVNIELDIYNKGPIPAKLPIINPQEDEIGIIFIQYEILKTQVNSVVQKLIDYEYLLKIKSFKLTFRRRLLTIPTFYFKFIIGKKIQQQNFPMEYIEEDDAFIYNYPVQFFIKNQLEIDIEIEMKLKPTPTLDSQSIFSINQSISTNRKQGKKNFINIEAAEKISTEFDLTFKQNGTAKRQLPVYMLTKKNQKEIGTLEFEAEIVFRTKKEKQQYQFQKKRQLELKNRLQAEASKKKQKKGEIKSNGHIIINSIIQKLELFNEEFIKNKNSSLQLRLGKQLQESAVQKNPGKQAIYMDTFIFKRTWEENLSITVYIHSSSGKVPKYYTDVNLRDLFEVGRFMAKKVQLKDQNSNYCGYLVLDITYRDQSRPLQLSPQKALKKILDQQQGKGRSSLGQESRPPQKEKKKNINKTADMIRQQRNEYEKQMKRIKILERMKLRQQMREQKQRAINSGRPYFSQNEIILPPLNSSRVSQPKSTKKSRINIYNKGGAQFFSRSPRFKNDKKDYEADSYMYKPISDFEGKRSKGASIGMGNKHDFTKQYEASPGVGRYYIPSVWDKYKN